MLFLSTNVCVCTINTHGLVRGLSPFLLMETTVVQYMNVVEQVYNIHVWRHLYSKLDSCTPCRLRDIAVQSGRYKTVAFMRRRRFQ